MSEAMAKKKSQFVPVISKEECKGCERCVQACPKSVLSLSNLLNAMGYPYAEYAGKGCVGCGNCFYACPEPGAVTIIEKLKKR